MKVLVQKEQKTQFQIQNKNLVQKEQKTHFKFKIKFSSKEN